MKPGDRVRVCTYDNIIVIGTVTENAVDHLILSSTNDRFGWIWIERYNIKEFNRI